MVYVRWTPYPVIVTIRENRDHVRVLLYAYYTTITGWGVLLRFTVQGLRVEGWLLASLDLEEELGGVPKPQKSVE